MSKSRRERRAARIAANKLQKADTDLNVKNSPNQKIVLNTHMERAEAFSGPLPHPSHLEHYNKIIPNGAERIFKMAENQADHRMGIEKSIVNADIRLSYFGLGLGFIIAMSVTGSGVYMTMQGKDIIGFVAIFAPLATIVGLFVYNRNSRPPNDKDKKK